MLKIQDLVLTVITHAAPYNSQPCFRHIYVRLTSTSPIGAFDLQLCPGGENLTRKAIPGWGISLLSRWGYEFEPVGSGLTWLHTVR